MFLLTTLFMVFLTYSQHIYAQTYCPSYCPYGYNGYGGGYQCNNYNNYYSAPPVYASPPIIAQPIYQQPAFPQIAQPGVQPGTATGQGLIPSLISSLSSIGSSLFG
ncbi:hypothetical protein DdX_06484 [Ditylenchus destructor]|uniref:Uncharacterized protein n=1 Tax=Ditylenchus destructor TaxID=166010 RepID=A0AAD4R8Z7_9BILA|nr:hypothetical protein DdX_06484 [Ditylenchus destructor]